MFVFEGMHQHREHLAILRNLKERNNTIQEERKKLEENMRKLKVSCTFCTECYRLGMYYKLVGHVEIAKISRKCSID